MSIATGTRFGPYEVLGQLGAGGMGEVYRARDTRLGREVAIKVLPAAFAADSDRLRRFEQEARAAGSINHPNILVLHDVGTHEGTPFLVTELLEGETLRARLREGALPARKAIDYAREIARGLDAAHQRGLAHRDLKPENIFILEDGRVKILDFGIAKFTRPDVPGAARPGVTVVPTLTTAPESVDTDPGTVVGSVGYMAPEQVRGQPADHRSDIFALGAILYEMLSGRRAFHGETSAETMTAILREDPPELERDGRPIPAALEGIVRHCIEKSPSERFQSASDVAFALQSLSGISDSGPKQAIAPARPSFRPGIVTVVAAGLLFALGLLVGLELSAAHKPSAIEYRRLTFRRGLIYVARFSSDGHTIYYGAAWDGGASRIYSRDLDNPGSPIVAAPDSSIFLAISNSNEMALLLRPRQLPHALWQGTLARLTPGGAPREILDGVTEADWSPDGASLAAIHVVGNRYRVEYPIGTLLYESPGWISHLRVSPDGHSVAFLEHPVFPDDRGYVMMIDGSRSPRALGPTFASAQGLAWAPRGRSVWVGGATRGNARSIYSIDPAGHARIVASLPMPGRVQDISVTGNALVSMDMVSVGILARGPSEDTLRDLSWLDWTIPEAISRDDRTLLFDEEGDGGGERYSVCIRGLDGSTPVRLGEGLAEDISSDGKWVLVDRFWTNPPELALLPTGAGESLTIFAKGLENIAHARFFSSGRRLLIVGNELGHGLRAYVLALPDGAPRPVTPEGVNVYRGELSPDDKWLPGNLPTGEGKLFPVDGGEPRRLPNLFPGEIIVGWSSDSKALYVQRPFMPRLTLTRLDIESGTRSSLVSVTGPDSAGPGRAIVGNDDHTYAFTYSRAHSDLFLARGAR